MAGKVIQGFFVGGQPRQPGPVTLPQLPPRSFAPTPFAIAPSRQVVQPQARPGPPAPAFAARERLAQARSAGDSFQIDAVRLGIGGGGGRPLPDSVRGKMEAALGADFSAVRVHVGPQAERIGALAFTMGTDIYFAPGRFQPDTVHGQQLLGHELAHVVQQRQGRVRNPLGGGVAVVHDRALEAEADRLGWQATTARTVQSKPRPAAAQPSAPVRISAPLSTAPGSYHLSAAAGGVSVGSVMVHARDRAAIEVTDLAVDPAHREHGIGKMLLASAARTGQRFGRSKVTLAAQDNGSGRLVQWYRAMGFAQVGVNQRGYPRLEAPIGRVLGAAVQRAASKVKPGRVPADAFMRKGPAKAIQAMDLNDTKPDLIHTGPPLDELMAPALQSAFNGNPIAEALFWDGCAYAVAAAVAANYNQGNNPQIPLAELELLRQAGLLGVKAKADTGGKVGGVNASIYKLVIKKPRGGYWTVAEWHVHWGPKSDLLGNPGWKIGRRGIKTPTGPNEHAAIRRILGNEFWGRPKNCPEPHFLPEPPFNFYH